MNENRSKVEIETDGTSFGTTVKINGQPVSNCIGVKFEILAGDLAYATVELHHVEIKFTGDLIREQADVS